MMRKGRRVEAVEGKKIPEERTQMGKYWKGILKRKVWVEIGGGEVGRRGGDQKGQDGGGGRDGKDCQDVVKSNPSLHM